MLHLQFLRWFALICAGVVVACPQSIQAQSLFEILKPSWTFERHSYYDPLSAEPRAAEMKVLFPARSSSVPFAEHPGQSTVWDISVGDEIPVIGWTRGDKPEGEPTAQKKFGFGVWFPLSFHMIEDMSKDHSKPILDTDYRFGVMLKAQWGLPSKWGITHQSHIGIRYVPIAHESTHLGDEFTLNARIYGDAFQRVNVSYQYWELGGSFEPNFFQDGRLEAKFRGGIMHEAFHGGVGWYDAELLQPVGGTVTLSNRNIEPYVGAELFYSPDPDTGGLGPFLSLDYRNRTVYGYNRPSQSTPEQVEGSVNILAGIRHIRRAARITPSYYLRYYHGVNPAGQFRSQSNYQLYGFGVLFRF